MMILLPLYSISRGFCVLKFGSVVTLPVLLGLGIRFVGGALCDRFGERLILQLCYLLSVFSAIVLVQAEGFDLLFLSQSIANSSHGIFWIACRSLVTQNAKNSNFGFGHRDPENSGGDRVPAPIGTPKQLAEEPTRQGNPFRPDSIR